jgi:hypothetical protein
MYVKYKIIFHSDLKKTIKIYFYKDLEYMCNTYESFEEQIEEEQDPKQLLENFKSKRIKSIVIPLEYHLFID